MTLRDREDVDAISQGISYLQNVVDKTLPDVRPGDTATRQNSPWHWQLDEDFVKLNTDTLI